MKKSDPPIIVEESFNLPIEAVWKSITELDYMKKWYFENIPEFKAEVGFKTNFMIEHDGRQFPHYWEVLEVVPNQKITYRWTFPNYPGVGDVTFALTEQKDGTLITLTNVVIEDFPDDVPEFRRESCEGGWKYFIQERLKEYFENK